MVTYRAAPRRFVLDRIEDETGLSGTGVVAWGIAFPDGEVVTRWCSDASGVHQTCVWHSIEHVQRVHGHNGATKVRWLDEPWQVIAPTLDRTFPMEPIARPIPLRPNPSEPF
ncbi:MAG: hypothetical protein ACRD0W_05740 [Acidimicrobiales bacterium]